jgi:tetratricopeptide (TPR) repeat protein
MGRIAHRRGELKESLEHLTKAAEHPSSKRAANLLLAQVHLALGDRDASLAARGTATRNRDESWPDPFLGEVSRLRVGLKASLAKADWLYDHGVYDQAIEIMQRAVRDYPDSEWAWIVLGKSLIKKKKYADAQDALEKALEIAPNSSEAQFRMGVIYFRRNIPSLAVEWFRKTIATKPDFTMAHYNLGLCLSEAGDREGAIESFSAAVASQPECAEAHALLGDILAKANRKEEAIAHLENAVSLAPNLTWARVRLREVRLMP